MNVYGRLDISFWYKNKEYKLHPISADEYDDSIEIVTSLRHPDIERGCIGNVVLYTDKGRDLFGNEAPAQEDFIQDALLRNIILYSANEGEPICWKYTFLKN